MMQKQITANKRKTIIIMIGFMAVFALIGLGIYYWVEDWAVSLSVLGIAAVYSLFQYFCASHVALAMTGAKQIQKKDNPELYNAVENICISTGLPMPKVYIIQDSAPNAFATGRDPEHASVAATTGLLDIMDKKELTAVMAHEMSHVKNYDIRVSTIVFGLVCLIGFISDLGLRMVLYSDRRDREDKSVIGLVIVLITSIFAPLAASLAQLAISREREYLADASSVNITRYPDGMISALKKLEAHSQPMRRQNAAAEALYINNPMRKGFISSLFSTHPPIEKRIERIENGKKDF